MDEENIREDEDAEDVEAHHFRTPGPEEADRQSLSEDDEDEVEAHHFRTPGPEDPGNRA